jgi:hypothetical protein
MLQVVANESTQGHAPRMDSLHCQHEWREECSNDQQTEE